MEKFIQSSVILMAGFILVGLQFAPNDILMSLAQAGTPAMALRLLVIICAAILLFTRPPRSIFVRLVLGLAAATLIGWTGYVSFTQYFPMLDSLLFTAAGISFAIAALEFSEKPKQWPARFSYYEF